MSAPVAHKLKDKERTNDVLISESVDFSGLFLSKAVEDGLTNAGFERPSPIQLKAIPLGRCGLDLIVQAKSGTGKTCVFSVVALENIELTLHCVQVLILAPTREIAQQIHSVIHTVGTAMPNLKCHTFIGGMPVLQDKILAKNCHIAVGTPGRVKQLIEIGALKTNSIRLFVLDEADELLKENQFQGSTNWIYSTLPANKQILALSATYPEYLAQHLTTYMRNPTFVRLNISDPALIGIKQYHVVVPNHPLVHTVFQSKTEVILKILNTVSFQQCLIFSNMQTRAQNLQSELQARNWPTACIAGCLDQRDRCAAIDELKSFKCRVLISTDLTSRGIDADKVNLIINLDVPYDAETYLHRIGRAGRFGSYGAAVTIVTAGGQDKELWSVEKKCKTKIPKLPDPIPQDLATRCVQVCLDDMVSTQQIINHPELQVKTEASSLSVNGTKSNGKLELVGHTNIDVPGRDRSVHKDTGSAVLDKAPIGAVSKMQPQGLVNCLGNNVTSLTDDSKSCLADGSCSQVPTEYKHVSEISRISSNKIICVSFKQEKNWDESSNDKDNKSFPISNHQDNADSIKGDPIDGKADLDHVVKDGKYLSGLSNEVYSSKSNSDTHTSLVTVGVESLKLSSPQLTSDGIVSYSEKLSQEILAQAVNTSKDFEHFKSLKLIRLITDKGNETAAGHNPDLTKAQIGVEVNASGNASTPVTEHVTNIPNGIRENGSYHAKEKSDAFVEIGPHDATKEKKLTDKVFFKSDSEKVGRGKASDIIKSFPATNSSPTKQSQSSKVELSHQSPLKHKSISSPLRTDEPKLPSPNKPQLSSADHKPELSRHQSQRQQRKRIRSFAVADFLKTLNGMYQDLKPGQGDEKHSGVEYQKKIGEEDKINFACKLKPPTSDGLIADDSISYSVSSTNDSDSLKPTDTQASDLHSQNNTFPENMSETKEIVKKTEHDDNICPQNMLETKEIAIKTEHGDSCDVVCEPLKEANYVKSNQSENVESSKCDVLKTDCGFQVQKQKYEGNLTSFENTSEKIENTENPIEKVDNEVNSEFNVPKHKTVNVLQSQNQEGLECSDNTSEKKYKNPEKESATEEKEIAPDFKLTEMRECIKQETVPHENLKSEEGLEYAGPVAELLEIKGITEQTQVVNSSANEQTQQPLSSGTDNLDTGITSKNSKSCSEDGAIKEKFTKTDRLALVSKLNSFLFDEASHKPFDFYTLKAEHDGFNESLDDKHRCDIISNMLKGSLVNSTVNERLNRLIEQDYQTVLEKQKQYHQKLRSVEDTDTADQQASSSVQSPTKKEKRAPKKNDFRCPNPVDSDRKKGFWSSAKVSHKGKSCPSDSLNWRSGHDSTDSVTKEEPSKRKTTFTKNNVVVSSNASDKTLKLENTNLTKKHREEKVPAKKGINEHIFNQNANTYNDSDEPAGNNSDDVQKKGNVPTPGKDDECSLLDDMHSIMLKKRQARKNRIALQPQSATEVGDKKHSYHLSPKTTKDNSLINNQQSPSKSDLSTLADTNVNGKATIEGMESNKKCEITTKNMSMPVSQPQKLNNEERSIDTKKLPCKEENSLKSQNPPRKSSSWQSVCSTTSPVKPSKSEARLAGIEVSDGSTSTTSEATLSSTSDVSDHSSSGYDVTTSDKAAPQCYTNIYAEDHHNIDTSNTEKIKDTLPKSRHRFTRSKVLQQVSNRNRDSSEKVTNMNSLASEKKVGKIGKKDGSVKVKSNKLVHVQKISSSSSSSGDESSNSGSDDGVSDVYQQCYTSVKSTCHVLPPQFSYHSAQSSQLTTNNYVPNYYPNPYMQQYHPNSYAFPPCHPYSFPQLSGHYPPSMLPQYPCFPTYTSPFPSSLPWFSSQPVSYPIQHPIQRYPTQHPMQQYPTQHPMQHYPTQHPVQHYPTQHHMQHYPTQHPMLHHPSQHNPMHHHPIQHHSTQQYYLTPQTHAPTSSDSCAVSASQNGVPYQYQQANCQLQLQYVKQMTKAFRKLRKKHTSPGSEE